MNDAIGPRDGVGAAARDGSGVLARRIVFFALVGAVALGLAAQLARVLGADGWTVAEVLLLLAFLGTAPWTGLCAANALVGFAILMTARNPARSVFPAWRDDGPLTLTTAIAVTVRNEDMGAVLPPLRALLDGLDAAGHGAAFGLYILSDTQHAAAAAAEEAAIAAFRAADPRPGRIHYRRRAANTGFKAGNVMAFLDAGAGGHPLLLMLDADSAMTAPAVLRLVRAMQADPRLGIAQQLIVGRPATSAFPRLFQFGMRAGMRTWATGQAWWQGDDGPYWGHNAMLRVAPFRAHCRLETLPDGSAILSHDQVEAVRMRAAGWKVRVLPEEEGSLEGNPPAMPEFLRRDLRWLEGNLQYRHLLLLPGIRPMGRWQLAQAMLLFAGAPLYVAMLALTALNGATGGAEALPRGPALALTLAWPAALYAPKLLGYAEVLLKPALAARYGGRRRLAAGAAAEFVFTLLLDPVSSFNKALFMAGLPFGARMGWAAQNRADRGVGWGEAARILWPHTLFGAAAFAGLAATSWLAVLWMLPFAGGLLVAIPLCVVTSAPGFSAWLRSRRIAATPEELAAG